MTGALPAQFGFRETGVIDIHTKNGAVFTGNEASIYVGSFDTFQESLERGGVTGKLSYYVTQSYLHNGIGIENPTRSSDNPIHDDTDQFKEFAYLVLHHRRYQPLLAACSATITTISKFRIIPGRRRCSTTWDKIEFQFGQAG